LSPRLSREFLYVSIAPEILLAHTRHPIRAVIAGKGPHEDKLKALATDLGLSNRITFPGFISEEELINHYSRCGAVWYAPLDEDYGYVTLEAFLSRKPVITATDSGGVLEFVEDGVSGFIGSSEPDLMAKQLDRWYEHQASSPDMGEKAWNTASVISWDTVIDQLTADLRMDIETQKNQSGEIISGS